MKILRYLLIAVVFLIVLWIGFSLLWWNKNQDEVLQRTEQALVEGKEIGQHATDEECVNAYIEIMPECDSIACGIQNQVFLQTCLEHSSATPWCNSVPAKAGVLEMARWAADLCMKAKVDNPQCASGLQEAVTYCKARL